MTRATEFWGLFQLRLSDRRFWIVQLLVLVVAALNTVIEAWGATRGVGDLYLLPVSLFVVPVVYASLTHGVEGALATWLWSSVLTLPTSTLFHSGTERIGISVQLAFLLLLGVMISTRVDRERRAKLAAEDANRRLAEIQASLKDFIGLDLRAQEEERFRISRELHDETVQELVVAKAALEVVVATPRQRAQLDVVDAALQRSIDGIRRLCQALRPSVLDDLGLVPALDWLLADLAARTGIRTQLQASGARPRLSPEQEMVIFRVTQEALHNIERHANASLVAVSFSCDPSYVGLEVLDDGCGFDPSYPRQGRLGLAGMQERASLIGAELEVSSRPGATCVSLDLRPSSDPAAA